MVPGLALFCVLIGSSGPAAAAGAEPAKEVLEPDPAWKKLGRNLWFDPQAKTVVLRAKVVLREGYLEHFLCSKGTKEHEAILATDAVPHQIHAGLILTGAEPGQPVKFVPKFEPPTGPVIVIDLVWRQDGKPNKANARDWIKDEKLKAPLAIDWVFAGSQFYVDPATGKQRYAADEGDLITVANFGSAILDLPIASSASDNDRVYVANTEKIPPLGTDVFVTLGRQPATKTDKPGPGPNPGR